VQRLLQVLGCLLILPLLVGIGWVLVAAPECRDECHGNVVYLPVVFLIAAPALAGLVLLAVSRRDD
jgi:membrane protein DedA with SNARE-associated domain